MSLTFRREKGFTLVELAIVMTIMGLLIGGVLKGRQFIQIAKERRVVADLKSFQAAAFAFKDKYDQMPGDMSNALTRLPGCTAGNFCANGNGNAKVGVDDQDTFIVQEGFVPTDQRSETILFWKHLILADIISGVDVSGNPQVPIWGITHPGAPFAGGYKVAYRQQGAGVELAFGHYIRIDSSALTPPNMALASFTARLPLSPVNMRRLDIKMDDGKPNTGYLLGEYNASGCDTSSLADATYQNTEQFNCILLWFFDR